jgi:hypothetical protein
MTRTCRFGTTGRIFLIRWRRELAGWRTPFTPLRDGQILDAGYGEFWVTPTTAAELMGGGMTHVNGAPVRLTIEDRFPDVNAVVVRWRPTESIEDIAAQALVRSSVTTRKEH